MTGSAITLLTLWLVLSVLSLWIWLPAGRGPGAALRATRRGRIAVLAAMVVLIGGCAVLSAVSAPLDDTWRWLAGALGTAVTVLGGGALTTIILALSGRATVSSSRVQRDVLRGGAWIGAVEHAWLCSAPGRPAGRRLGRHRGDQGAGLLSRAPNGIHCGQLRQ